MKKHYLALICAIAVGLASVAPQFLAARALGDHYQGIPFLYLDDEDIYLARIREVTDGHAAVSSPVFLEYKDAAPFVVPIGEWLYAAPAIAFGVSSATIAVISKFAFPAALFLLVYFLLIELSVGERVASGRANAIAGGLLVTLGYDFVDVRSVIALMIGQAHTTHLLIWTRLVNPITGALLLFVLISLLWRIARNKRGYLFIPAGLVLGAMIYYFFSWAFALSLLASAVILSAFRKKYVECKNLLLAAVISFLVQLPYWYAVADALSRPEGGALAARYGEFFTHAPVINKFLLVTTIVFVPFFVAQFLRLRQQGEKLDDWWWFCMALLIAGWLVFNQQVITGRTIWPYHFVQYTIPIGFFVLFIFFNNYVRPRLAAVWLFVVSATVVGALFFGIHSAASYRYKLDDFRGMQSYAPFFSQLNTAAPKDCVVLVSETQDRLARLIPAFTHCNVYLSTYIFSRVPPERIRHNFFVALRLRGIAADSAEEYLRNHVGEVNTIFFDDWNEIFSTELTAKAEERIRQLASDYKEFTKKDFVGELKKYRLDYIASETPLDDALVRELSASSTGTFGSVSLYIISPTGQQLK